MKIKKSLALFCLVLTVFLAVSPAGGETVRIKDITEVEGVRGNQLVGYGLVVGLAGSGDSRNSLFTNQALANMLEKMGIAVDSQAVRARNVASVIVTAELPPFVQSGEEIDVTVSSLGRHKTLQGGVLLLTPLKSSRWEGVCCSSKGHSFYWRIQCGRRGRECGAAKSSHSEA